MVNLEADRSTPMGRLLRNEMTLQLKKRSKKPVGNTMILSSMAKRYETLENKGILKQVTPEEAWLQRASDAVSYKNPSFAGDRILFPRVTLTET